MSPHAGGFVLDPVEETKAVVAQAPQLGRPLAIVPFVHLGRSDAAAVSASASMNLIHVTKHNPSLFRLAA